MKTLTPLLFALLLTAGACQNTKKETSEVSAVPEPAGPSLTRKWATDTLLTTCESVVFDAGNNVLYVSNIAGVPDDKDGNGFISRITLDGEITDRQWVTGLDAPKGMGLRGGSLFVTDIDRIVEIDTQTAKVVRSYPVAEAQFLNDITVDGEGNVYASDSNVGFIVQIAGTELTMWADSLDGPNGVLADGGKILMASWNSGTLNVIDPATKSVTTRAGGIEHPGRHRTGWRRIIPRIHLGRDGQPRGYRRNCHAAAGHT